MRSGFLVQSASRLDNIATGCRERKEVAGATEIRRNSGPIQMVLINPYSPDESVMWT